MIQRYGRYKAQKTSIFAIIYAILTVKDMLNSIKVNLT